MQDNPFGGYGDSGVSNPVSYNPPSHKGVRIIGLIIKVLVVFTLIVFIFGLVLAMTPPTFWIIIS